MSFDGLLDKGNNFVVGWVAAWLLSIPYWTYTESYQAGQKNIELIKQCQVKLPRDEFCAMIAVPTKEVSQ